MKKELTVTETNLPGIPIPTEQAPAARALLLGGVAALNGGAPHIEPALESEIAAYDLRIFALHTADESAAAWLLQNNPDVVCLAGMDGDRPGEAIAARSDVQTIGAGATQAMANRPFVSCVNGIRIGVLSYSERRAGGFDQRADILGLMAYDQVRMLLSQCDHVIVLLRAGLPGARLPLPEWRERYRRFIDAGASVVADTGAAKGWEAYKNGLVFYGLGAPTGNDSLLLSLTLGQNGRMDYEARALECVSGEVKLSKNHAFKTEIDRQNELYLHDSAYLREADELCLRLYEEQEQPKKHGIFQTLLSAKNDAARREEDEKMIALLGDESRRLMVLRALRQRGES